MAKYHAFTKKARRLNGYDYRLEGLYFVTICTLDRAPYFGEVRNREMVLSDEGQIAHDYWLEIEQYWPTVRLGDFVVMPNHVHGIVELPLDDSRPPEQEANRNGQEKNQYMAALTPKAGSLSLIIGAYKTACTKMMRSVSTEPFGWQPRFHDRIIRNQRELVHIENYILSNPANWQEDQFYKL